MRKIHFEPYGREVHVLAGIHLVGTFCWQHDCWRADSSLRTACGGDLPDTLHRQDMEDAILGRLLPP